MTYIIILNYNGWKDTIECLNSLSCIQEDCKIVLIDNKSTDDSIDKLEKWIQNQKELSSNLIFIKSSENNGYAAGNNIGIKYVESQEDAQFIWILNNDTLIQEDTFKNLINCYKNLENENIALLGIKILNEDFSIQSIGYLNSKYTEDDFCEFSIDLDENFKIALKQLIKEDENGNKGLNELSFHFLELVKQNITYEVHKSIVIGSLTTEFLVQLFAKEK